MSCNSERVDEVASALCEVGGGIEAFDEEEPEYDALVV
jgi:hypothetical protein